MYFAVARYNPNGALDTSFGSSGIATTNPSVNGSDRARSVPIPVIEIERNDGACLELSLPHQQHLVGRGAVEVPQTQFE